MIIPVIMAGGSGTRLWPLSKSGFPKQFLALNGSESMLQQTIRRLSGLQIGEPIILCNERHRFLVSEQLREINAVGRIVLEPEGRNTAPAIALAALVESDADALLLVLPADHIVSNEAGLVKAFSEAVPLAREGKLVTFGAKPTEPNTGYGYIETGDEIAPAYHVKSFKEKPDRETVDRYLCDGGYLWNSGMFLFQARRYLEVLETHRPDIFDACKKAYSGASVDLGFLRLDVEAFKKCPSESIDYAVMEKTSDAVVVPIDVGWSDVGSWDSLWRSRGKDAFNNVVSGDTELVDTTGSLVISEGQFVATNGVKDLVVVVSKDAVLVSSMDSAQDIKALVSQWSVIAPSALIETEVHRPWGKFVSIDTGYNHQVKRITVKVGAKLSLQKHEHRAEHWIVVTGKAKVVNGDRTFNMLENESTFIPPRTVHCLENIGDVPLEIIEVQAGEYLGEDDIVRLEDIYGRMK